MADEHHELPLDTQEALRLLDEARARLRTAIWALHGMHQDMNVLTAEDVSDIEHMLTEILEGALHPSCEVLGELFGTGTGETITTH